MCQKTKKYAMDSQQLKLFSSYSLKRTEKIRKYMMQRQKIRRFIISNHLESLKLNVCLMERIISMYNPPTRVLVIYRPIEVGQDLLEIVNENRFLSAFRISKENFRYICNVLRPDLEPKFNPISTTKRKASVEEKVAICLYKLKSKCEYPVVSNVFGFSPASVCNFFHDVVSAIVKRLTPLHIKMPNAIEAKVISEEFRQTNGFPQTIGCIDGSHIPITAPSNGSKDYLNRKGFHSIILQAVVDNKCR